MERPGPNGNPIYTTASFTAALKSVGSLTKVLRTPVRPYGLG